ncbi:MAG: hypothetical protein JSW38_01855 [Dehalococcoidia bacterium]|nr:MAG: hypothetical protein JSW38_01855 [Dehalococcoidia bacterium]
MKIIKILVASLIVSILIISCVVTGCGNNSGESNTFSKYGFSFEYPENFSLTRDEVDRGVIYIEIDKIPANVGEAEYFQIMCGDIDENVPAPDPYEFLYSTAENLHELGTRTEGPKTATAHLGHQVPYQLYTLQYDFEVEEEYHVSAAFYCDMNNRLFVILFSSEAANDWAGATDAFTSFLYSFACH